MDMPLHPGDPLTPGVGATADAKRLPIQEAATLTKIPVLPISYEDALPLLRAIGGPVAPEAWRGALPLTYHLGAGPAKARLKLEFDWKLVPTYNVIARMPGSERPQQWIVRGNHHDAWVNGADDPVSGMVAVMEEARVLSELAKSGWRPRRTILYCAWDGEEQGLLGSTEWAETHAAELKEHVAVYINSDSNGRGFLHAGGSHPLEKLVHQAARDVVDPQKKISVAERLRALRLTRGAADEQRDARDRADLRLGALGSGSDYTVFLDHLGIASLDVGFSGEDRGGSYHSIYDSFDHYSRFGDPDFVYGAALVQTAGRIVLRLANADTLPFDFSASADAVAVYANEVIKLADDLREETERHNRLVREGRIDAAADPSETRLPETVRPPVPHLNFAPLQNAVDLLQHSARENDQARRDLEKSGRALSADAAGAIDGVVLKSERALTVPETGRPGCSGPPRRISQVRIDDGLSSGSIRPGDPERPDLRSIMVQERPEVRHASSEEIPDDPAPLVGIEEQAFLKAVEALDLQQFATGRFPRQRREPEAQLVGGQSQGQVMPIAVGVHPERERRHAAPGAAVDRLHDQVVLEVQAPMRRIESSVRDREMVAKLVNQDACDERRALAEVVADPARAEPFVVFADPVPSPRPRHDRPAVQLLELAEAAAVLFHREGIAFGNLAQQLAGLVARAGTEGVLDVLIQGPRDAENVRDIGGLVEPAVLEAGADGRAVRFQDPDEVRVGRRSLFGVHGGDRQVEELLALHRPPL